MEAPFDEQIFYKMFGDYPKKGDKIPSEKLSELGTHFGEVDDYNCIWENEFSCAVHENRIEGKDYMTID